jgi:transposase
MKELRELRKELDAAVKPGHEQVVDRLFDVIEKLANRCERLEKENQRLRQRIAELEKQDSPASTPTGAASSFSLDAEQKRRQRKDRKRKTTKKKRKSGRKPNKDKLDCVARWVDILPEGARKQDCQLQSKRPVWHIEDGRAVRVGYRIYRLPWGETPRIPGVLPRCEYSVEIHVLLAYLVYVIGISIDKACQLLRFFCQLPLEPSQADNMLTQLGKQWGEEFDVICERIALAAVVYADETSWRVGRLNTSLWSFTSDLHCVMLFGCSKDRQTLESILPPEIFDGVLVSDDAAVYREGYRGQKCWAHLLRKAVKLALLHPEHPTYGRFLDDLLALYRDAKRASKDTRLSDKGREVRASQLEARLCDICHPHWPNITPGLPEPQTASETDFRNLVNELLRLMLAEQLFVFVLDPQVEATNNLSERQLRNSALARKANRTSKTDTGSTRQTRIVSVLESLRRSLDDFTINTVVDRVASCMHRTISMFQPTGPPVS